MSLCINNDLIWVAIPRCASYSVQTALINSDLSIKLYSEYEKDFDVMNEVDLHAHFKVNTLKEEFGNKETICLKRDWFDRWLSGLELIFDYMGRMGHKPTVPIEEINNKYIFKTIDSEFVNLLYGDTIKIFNKLSNDDLDTTTYDNGLFRILLSQNYWKLNKPCTYEFDIKEMNKFEDFINKKYNTNLKVQKLNSIPKKLNGLVINDELKNWIWDLFEKKYTINGLI